MKQSNASIRMGFGRQMGRASPRAITEGRIPRMSTAAPGPVGGVTTHCVSPRRKKTPCSTFRKALVALPQTRSTFLICLLDEEFNTAACGTTALHEGVNRTVGRACPAARKPSIASRTSATVDLETETTSITRALGCARIVGRLAVAVARTLIQEGIRLSTPSRTAIKDEIKESFTFLHGLLDLVQAVAVVVYPLDNGFVVRLVDLAIGLNNRPDHWLRSNGADGQSQKIANCAKLLEHDVEGPLLRN